MADNPWNWWKIRNDVYLRTKLTEVVVWGGDTALSVSDAGRVNRIPCEQSPVRGERCGRSNSLCAKNLQIMRGSRRQKPRPAPTTLAGHSLTMRLLLSCQAPALFIAMSANSQVAPQDASVTLPPADHCLPPLLLPNHQGCELPLVQTKVCIIPSANSKGLRCPPSTLQGIGPTLIGQGIQHKSHFHHWLEHSGVEMGLFWAFITFYYT